MPLVAGAGWLVLRPRPVDVDVAVVTVGPMRATVDADAITRVREHFTITAPVTGLLRRIALAEGDSLRAGEIVAVVGPAPADPATQRVAAARREAALAAGAQAEARERQAEASLAQTERDAARTRALVAAGALADRDGERAALAVDAGRRDVDAARAQQGLAAAELAQASAAYEAAIGASGAATVVRAPAAGRVLRIPDASARVVAAGTPLMEAGDPSRIEVAADVLSSEAVSVRPGQSVELRGWGGAPLAGRVRRVEPSARTRISALGVEEQRLTVVIDITDPPLALADGYRLDAYISVWQAERALQLPASALLRGGDGIALYQLTGGRLRRRMVRVGHTGGDRVELLGGLAAGDTVVVFPSDALRDGGKAKAGG